MRSATWKAKGPRGRTPIAASGWRFFRSLYNGASTNISRRATSQVSNVGSSEPTATIAIAQPINVAAVPMVTYSDWATATPATTSTASTRRLIPTVKRKRARPRRVRFE
ncbi:Uncharacterised protein [Mycobacteroides abscessus subsp. abscessus]|nr:Uncharacterised protein [Mycobacteroides abscessus subsp. abscessus]SKV83529.1 Uncharacterised protein [Mycobacteroides abscessus subsp. abscessus]